MNVQRFYKRKKEYEDIEEEEEEREERRGRERRGERGGRCSFPSGKQGFLSSSIKKTRKSIIFEGKPMF